MAKVDPFQEYVVGEVLQHIPGISARAMFGGSGIYKDGLFFAMIADGKLYFKVDESNKADFASAGSTPFVYPMPNGKTTTMNYWEIPDSVIEDKEEIEKWVEKSVEVAKNSKKK